ncbi:MAG: histidinol-phosphate transaminase, partial [Woeseiaceae bacterium]
MNVLELARPALRGLSPYPAAEQAAGVTRLNANELPWGTLNRYPELRPTGLSAAMANHYGCKQNQLLITRGSSEAIDLLVRSLCRPGVDNIVTAPPTFSMYAHYAAIQGAGIRTAPTTEDVDFAVDSQRVLDVCNEFSKIVFLCSPNNPTGNSMSPAAIREVATHRAGRSIVVIDEAYIEFSGFPSAAALLDELPNVVVLRTMSKAHGLAGARCGAVIASADAIGLLATIQAPYAIATPVANIVESELRSNIATALNKSVAAIVSERARLVAQLETMPEVLRVFPSDANFLLVKFRDARAILHRCRTGSVLPRFFGGELDRFLRITVGTRDENDRFLELLATTAK